VPGAVCCADWIGRAGRGTRRRLPGSEFTNQLSVFIIKELIRIIRAPTQFFFVCVMGLTAALLVGKLRSHPNVDEVRAPLSPLLIAVRILSAPCSLQLPSTNMFALMTLAILSVVQSVDLYGDEADRLSYFRDAARARNNFFMPTLFLAKQVSGSTCRPSSLHAGTYSTYPSHRWQASFTFCSYLHYSPAHFKQ
jgi:hypothetical protein